ncbi:DUF4276 family protein [Candidatus Palauibacter sp.]|uniref:DUF4276 family protein n=1 Tax=Candidatus Palauibacter sp. TaxID=3101350 RepID=UPI003D0B637C
MSIKLYVEGGGDSKALTTDCRRGFRKFFEKAGLAGQMPRIRACGSRRSAYDDFKAALGNGSEVPMLLVDAEDPLTAGSSWEHLRHRAGDRWARPTGASNDHCHLMVQVMESWFLADQPALESFFGQGFQPSALPRNPHIEQIRKADVLRGLTRATKRLETNRESYDKGSDSFEILGRIDPSRVESASPSAKQLLDVLRAGGPTS